MEKTYLLFVVILMLMSSLLLPLFTTQSYAQQQTNALNKAMLSVNKLAAIASACRAQAAHNPEILTACTNVLNDLNSHFDQLFAEERGDIGKILGGAP
jgi:hypothetical protein